MRGSSSDFIRIQDWNKMQESYNSLNLLQQQTNKALQSQIELTNREKTRVTELENRLSECNLKYDDSKTSYFKSKAERERLR